MVSERNCMDRIRDSMHVFYMYFVLFIYGCILYVFLFSFYSAMYNALAICT